MNEITLSLPYAAHIDIRKEIEVKEEMGDVNTIVKCAIHGTSYATFVCQHIAQGSGQGFYPGDSDDIRPDAWCEACENRVMLNKGEWTEELEKIAGITLLCAGCYDQVRLRNEIPNRRVKPDTRPTIEEDGWELDSALRQNRLHPESFEIPNKYKIDELKTGDLVKLLFLFGVVNESGIEEIRCERMWVSIQEKMNERFVGTLENTPTLSKSLSLSANIGFSWWHIADTCSLEQLENLPDRTDGFQMVTWHDNRI